MVVPWPASLVSRVRRLLPRGDARRVGRAARVLLLCGVAPALLATACGLGAYRDDGTPTPGEVWTWVCPDGGAPDGDAGCSAACAGDACGDGEAGE